MSYDLFNEAEFRTPTKYDSMLQRIDSTFSEPTITEAVTADEAIYCYGVDHLEQLSLPESEKAIHLMTNGRIDLTTILQWIATNSPSGLKYAMICAWSYGHDDIKMLQEMLGNKTIGQLDVVGSDMHPKKHRYDHTNLYAMYKTGSISRYSILPIHAKMILAETNDGQKYVVNSTANCTIYSCQETSVISHSVALFDYYKEYFKELDNFEAKEKYLDIAEDDDSDEEPQHIHLIGD